MEIEFLSLALARVCSGSIDEPQQRVGTAALHRRRRTKLSADLPFIILSLEAIKAYTSRGSVMECPTRYEMHRRRKNLLAPGVLAGPSALRHLFFRTPDAQFYRPNHDESHKIKFT